MAQGIHSFSKLWSRPRPQLYLMLIKKIAVPSLCFPLIINGLFTVLYSGRHLSIAFFSFHSVFLSHGKLWVLLVICKSWFDVQYLFLRYWINPRCAILNSLPCNHSKKQKFLGKNWLHVSRVKKSLLYCLSSDRRFFESFRWSRKFWIENPKPS